MVKKLGILHTTMVYGSYHIAACTLSNELKYEKELMERIVQKNTISNQRNRLHIYELLLKLLPY